jgi:16S rRNA (guanine1516-N2)-methyltransferase
MHALAVTTSDRRDPALAALARAAAHEVGVPFIERRHDEALRQLLETRAESLVVFEAGAVSLVDAEGTLRFSPGLAHLRVKQLDRGVGEDMLMRVGQLREGERVLDCTLGLAGDAQVAARLVGPNGAVTGLEKSPGLFLLARRGLELLPRHPKACPIKVEHQDAAEALPALPDDAFDVVLYDPMFERQRKSSAAFEALRRHADHSPLTPETLAHARRVAKRVVVLKGSRYSRDFKKLGVVAEAPRRSATVLWAALGK